MKKMDELSPREHPEPLAEAPLSSRIYRVQAGQYRTLEEAEQAAEQLRREGWKAFAY